jgi:hypothetical protein
MSAVATPPASTETEPTPAPGTPAAFAAAGDVRAFMAAREAQTRGERVAATPTPAEPETPTPAEGETVAAPVEGQEPPAAGEPPAQTEDERAEAEAEAAAKASEAGRTLAEAKKSKKSRADEIRDEIAHETWRKHKIREETAAEEARLQAVRDARIQAEREAAAKPAEPAAPTRVKPQITDPAAPGYFAGSYDEFVEVLTDWKIEQREAASAAKVTATVDQRLQAERDAAAQRARDAENDKTIAAHNTRVVEFAKTKDDYYDVLAAAQADPVRSLLPPVIGGYMIQSVNGPAIAYALATMPLDEFREFQGLSPDLALVAVGRLEARLAPRAASHPAGPTPVRNPVKLAARPISPVGTSAPVTAIPSAELAERDPKAFMQQRDADERRRRMGR